MASMFAKLQQQKEEEPEKKPTILEIAKPNDERYYICTEDGKMLACGGIDDVLSQLPDGYQAKETKYWFYDRGRDTVKVAF